MKIATALTCVLMPALIAAAKAQPAGGSPRQYAQLEHCIVSLIDDIDLPAEQEGVLRIFNVVRGQVVKEGQLLGKIDDQKAALEKKASEHELAVATEQATNRSELDAAKKITEVAEAEYIESVNLNKRGDVIPLTQVRRQKLQWERSILEEGVAETNLDVAKLQLKVAEAKLEAADHKLKELEIRAPFVNKAGQSQVAVGQDEAEWVVAILYKHQSEWVRAGDRIVRLVRMDRLRVEGFLNVDQYSPDEVVGAEVVVTVAASGGRKEQFRGTIDYVSPLVEASGDFRIWTEVNNRPGYGGYPWLLLPGTEAEMTITLNRTVR